MPPMQSFLRRGLAAPCLIRLARPSQVSCRGLAREPYYARKARDCKSPYITPYHPPHRIAPGVPRRKAKRTGAYRSNSLPEHDLWLATDEMEA